MRLVRTASLIMVLAASLTLAACGTMGSSAPRVNTLGQPERVQPVATSQVSSTALQPLPGSAVAPGLSGTPVLGGVQSQPMQTASTDPNFVSLSDPSLPGAAPVAGRDLTGGLTVDKLLGGWTVSSGATTCRLNLTYTDAGTHGRYRASAPGCAISGMATVAAWQLSGNQVQLFDASNNIVAAMALSGNRFVGTSAGGQGISMTS